MVTLGRTPRFVKNYMACAAEQGTPDIESAVRAYVREVKSGAYPAPEHRFDVPAPAAIRNDKAGRTARPALKRPAPAGVVRKRRK